MIELVYISRSKYTFSQKELDELLAVSRENNAKDDITGMLLYDGVATFIQVLEGPPDAVDNLYNKILQDERHDNVQKLSRAEVRTRTFGHWRMGYRRFASDTAPDPKGYSRFLDIDDESVPSHSDSMAAMVLRRFKRSVPPA